MTDPLGGGLLWSADQPEKVSAEPLEVPCEGADREGSFDTSVALRFEFLTPLRLRDGGCLNPRDVDGLSLLLAGRRRYEVLRHFYGRGSFGGEPPPRRFEAGEFRVLESDVRPWGFERFSGRQRRRMRLDGLLGHMVIQGPWGETGPWLHALPRIHVGKRRVSDLAR